MKGVFLERVFLQKPMCGIPKCPHPKNRPRGDVHWPAWKLTQARGTSCLQGSLGLCVGAHVLEKCKCWPTMFAICSGRAGQTYRHVLAVLEGTNIFPKGVAQKCVPLQCGLTFSIARRGIVTQGRIRERSSSRSRCTKRGHS